jgi:hypothetical protein
MANTTVNLITEAIGGGGVITFDLGVDGATHIYKGVLVTQLTGTGYIVPYSTAAAGVCVGVSQHEADNSAGADNALRCVIESRRMFALTNGAGGDAFSDASLIGSLVYATDDHTVADNSATQTLKPVGFFYGMEADGKVRVFIDPHTAKIVETLQLLTDAPASADALRENIIAAFG